MGNQANNNPAEEQITIVECPRDAWQGLRQIIPTEEKIKYLSSLVSLGFRHIDAVSFVSPKHVPQMADSEAVMKELSRVKSPSGEAPEIIGIIVNAQGLERALSTPGVTTIGYPYSISAYFRRANANMSRAESRDLVQKIQRDTKAAGKQIGRLCFDGVRESLRRAVGTGDRRGNCGVAERYRSADDFAGGHGGDGFGARRGRRL